MTNVAVILRSWRTTLAGVILILDAVGHVAYTLLDSNPETVPDWNMLVAVIVAAVGLIFAKDAKVSGSPRYY
jgi:hypothetical protein